MFLLRQRRERQFTHRCIHVHGRGKQQRLAAPIQFRVRAGVLFEISGHEGAVGDFLRVPDSFEDREWLPCSLDQFAERGFRRRLRPQEGLQQHRALNGLAAKESDQCNEEKEADEPSQASIGGRSLIAWYHRCAFRNEEFHTPARGSIFAGATPGNPESSQLKAVAKVSGTENFVGSLCRNLCRIGHFSTKASTKYATKMQNQYFCNRLKLGEQAYFPAFM